MNMERPLSELSLSELWALFPITIVPYDPCWKSFAIEEMNLLSDLLSGLPLVITHIGSTSVPGLSAKPIIDILIELPQSDFEETKTRLEESGYNCMKESADRLAFNKGYTPRGYADKVFHIHIHCPGDNDEILFRDFLRNHPEKASEYEKLKKSLLTAFRCDRDGYTQAKNLFVRSVIDLARKSDS